MAWVVASQEAMEQLPFVSMLDREHEHPLTGTAVEPTENVGWRTTTGTHGIVQLIWSASRPSNGGPGSVGAADSENYTCFAITPHELEIVGRAKRTDIHVSVKDSGGVFAEEPVVLGLRELRDVAAASVAKHR